MKTTQTLLKIESYNPADIVGTRDILRDIVMGIADLRGEDCNALTEELFSLETRAVTINPLDAPQMQELLRDMVKLIDQNTEPQEADPDNAA